LRFYLNRSAATINAKNASFHQKKTFKAPRTPAQLVITNRTITTAVIKVAKTHMYLQTEKED
jgi:hypothetical protein